MLARGAFDRRLNPSRVESDVDAIPKTLMRQHGEGVCESMNRMCVAEFEHPDTRDLERGYS